MATPRHKSIVPLIEPNTVYQELNRTIAAVAMIRLAELGADVVCSSDRVISSQCLFCEVAPDACKVLRESRRIAIVFGDDWIRKDTLASIEIERDGDVHAVLGQSLAGERSNSNEGERRHIDKQE